MVTLLANYADVSGVTHCPLFARWSFMQTLCEVPDRSQTMTQLPLDSSVLAFTLTVILERCDRALAKKNCLDLGRPGRVLQDSARHVPGSCVGPADPFTVLASFVHEVFRCPTLGQFLKSCLRAAKPGESPGEPRRRQMNVPGQCVCPTLRYSSQTLRASHRRS